MIPEKIEVKNKKLLIVKWNDGSTSQIKLTNLRRNCPCAVCKVEREEQSKSYIPIYGDVELAVTDLQVIGQYALKVVWKDGHDNGIFEFEFLKQISE